MTTTIHTFPDGKGPVPAHRHHLGGGWVADTANVHAHAIVEEHAQVFGTAVISRCACVADRAVVYDSAIVLPHACISLRAEVFGDAIIGEMEMSGNTHCLIGAAKAANSEMMEQGF